MRLDGMTKGEGPFATSSSSHLQWLVPGPGEYRVQNANHSKNRGADRRHWLRFRVREDQPVYRDRLFIDNRRLR